MTNDNLLSDPVSKPESDESLSDITSGYLRAADLITQKTRENMQTLIKINKDYPKKTQE